MIVKLGIEEVSDFVKLKSLVISLIIVHTDYRTHGNIPVVWNTTLSNLPT